MKERGSELNRSLSLKQIIYVSILLLACVSADSVETTARGRKTLTKIVESVENTATSSKVCVFENEVNSWCFT